MATYSIKRSCRFCNNIFSIKYPHQSYCCDICRFLDYVDTGNLKNCWPYKKALDICGYGKFTVNYKEFKAHRFLWQIINGPIPGNLCVLHKCDNPPCCNPNHLFIGTSNDNFKDMIQKGRRKSDKGSLNPQAKLNEVQVCVIRDLIHKKVHLSTIANKFKISLSSIYDIKDKKTWSHI